MSLKRTFDIAAAAVGLAVASPVILTVAAMMAFSTGSIPFFMQERVGLHGRLFKILKIKTMRDMFDAAGNQQPDDQRTTYWGKRLRKSRLDELPQLFNILAGDMSFVGPRPLCANNYVALDPYRQSVVPGLTGVAQISGNNKLSLEEFLACDHAYINDKAGMSAWQGLKYDLGIVLRTPASLIEHRDAPHCRV